MDEAVAGVDEDGVALDGVRLRVARRALPQRRPRADVAPADVDGHHRRLLGLLHHRVVDGDVGRAREGGAVEAQEVQIVRRFGEGLARRCQDLRGQLLELRQEGARVQHEDAAVPEVALIGDVGFRGGAVRASRKRHRPHSRRRRLPAERRAGCSRSRCAARSARCRTSTSLPVAATAAARFRLSAKAAASLTTWSDGMTAITASADFCTAASAATATAAAVLRATGSRMIASASMRGARQLLAHEEAVVVVADDDRGGKAAVVDAPQGGAEQAALPVEEADELLGIHRPRQRPQARAGAAGQDHGNDHTLHLPSQRRPAICHGTTRWRFTVPADPLPGLLLGMLYSGCGFPHKAQAAPKKLGRRAEPDARDLPRQPGAPGLILGA